MKMNKSYNELIRLKTFEERFEYLMIRSTVGKDTFGSERYINQLLYTSGKWRRRRDDVIIRDNGCDLGVVGYEIYGPITVHHINPITVEDIVYEHPCVFDMNNLISTATDTTHKAIHYSNENIIFQPIERFINDTCPWRH